MSTARYVHTATRLTDGRVLVTGGYTGSVFTASAGIYEPDNILIEQTIIVTQNAPISAVYGTIFNVAATGGGSGNAVVIAASGSCSGGGNNTVFITMTSGTGTCTVTFDQAGNANYAAAPQVVQMTTAQKATTTISINNIPSSAVYGGNFTPTYTYTGDGATSVTSSTASTCTVTSGVVNYVGAGTCTLVAHATAGTNYAAVDGADQSFTIAQATPTISINNIPSGAVNGGSFTPTFAYTGDGTISVTSSTQSRCTVTGGVVNFVGGGQCTLTASATATANVAAATGSPQSFTISPASATISINNIPGSAAFGGSFKPTFAYIGNGKTAATSSTPTKCTVANNGVVSFVGVGNCILTANATATADYLAAIGSPQSFNIGQATTTISIKNIPKNAKLGGSFTPTYNYTGDGTTSSTSSTSTCTVSGAGVVTYVGFGTCTLTAHATAGANYQAVDGSAQSFTIK
jgi:hypothetical protein